MTALSLHGGALSSCACCENYRIGPAGLQVGMEEPDLGSGIRCMGSDLRRGREGASDTHSLRTQASRRRL